jgi:hypothetical protein
MIAANGFCDHRNPFSAQSQSAGRNVTFPDMDRAGSEQIREHAGSAHHACNQALG